MQILSPRTWLLVSAAGAVASAAVIVTRPRPPAPPAVAPEFVAGAMRARATEDWQVLCGEQIPTGVMALAGDSFTVKEWIDNPPGSHAQEIQDLLDDPDSMIPAFALALRNYLLENGAWVDLSCGPCEDPKKCFIWLTGWEPGPEIHYTPESGGGKVWIQATLLNDFYVTAMCTDC